MALERRKEPGEAWATVEASGGGGSESGWQLADFLFTEQDTPGVISATVDLPAYSWPLGLYLDGISDWFDALASLKVEDDQAVVYYESEQAFADDNDAGYFSAQEVYNLEIFDGGNIVLMAHLPEARTITVSYTTTVADPAPTGQTRVVLIYATGTAQVAVP